MALVKLRLLGQRLLGQRLLGQKLIGQRLIGQRLLDQRLLGQRLLGQTETICFSQAGSNTGCEGTVTDQPTFVLINILC